MKSPRTGLGNDNVLATLPTPGLSATKEVLVVAGGVQTNFIKEKSIVDCAKPIDEMSIPNMPESENIVADMLGFSTLESTPEPKPYYFDHLAHNYVPYRHPRHRRNRNHAFQYLEKQCER